MHNNYYAMWAGSVSEILNIGRTTCTLIDVNSQNSIGKPIGALYMLGSEHEQTINN